VSSGVESSPGIKDGELIRRLFSAARACSSD
jgi:phosphoribosylanthranilate isomerase